MEDKLLRQLKSETCKLFRRFGKNAEVFLRSSKTKGIDYDPIRDEGYSISNQNSVIIKAWVRNPSSNGKLLQEIGTFDTGAKELIIFKKDLTVLKIAEKIVVDGLDYHILNDAAGDRFASLERIYDLVRVVVWRKDGDE